MTRLPRVLLVDDDPRVLDGLQRTLRGSFDTVTATGADAGMLAFRASPFEVVVSDLRMPGTDGIAFLSMVRRVSPDSVRVLLTGFGDLEAAMKAVNEGQVFRFLRKPCPAPTVLAAVQAAAHQHALVVGERELLEGTLHGCVDALADVLAITSPRSFARAMRVKEWVRAFTERFGIPDQWQMEVAATLSQIGAASLPHDLAEKVYFGRPLNDEEVSLAARLPSYAAGVVAHIPRLDAVRDILAHVVPSPDDDAGATIDNDSIPLGACLLRIAFAFDVLVTQGHTPDAALEALTACTGVYDPYLLYDVAVWQGEQRRAKRTRQILVSEVVVGMTLVADVLDAHGMVLVAHGRRISARALDLIRSYFGDDASKRTVYITIDDPSEVEEAAALELRCAA
jgi:response regulator RpfG family c-di-GMP phosphodiesterase